MTKRIKSHRNIAFDVEKSITGYYRLLLGLNNGSIHDNILIYDDPSSEDFYDEDTATSFFEDYIEKNFNEYALNVINRAFSDGYDLSTAIKDPEGLIVDCENYICEHCDIDCYEKCELSAGRMQTYTYDGRTCSGDIWRYDMYGEFYPENEDGEIDFSKTVKGFEIEHGKPYAFVFDTVVNAEGKKIALYDIYID